MTAGKTVDSTIRKVDDGGVQTRILQQEYRNMENNVFYGLALSQDQINEIKKYLIESIEIRVNHRPKTENEDVKVVAMCINALSQLE